MTTTDQSVLEALLGTWDRNNMVLLGLLRALPERGLEVRATEGGPSAAQLFTHIHFCRLVLIAENAPEFARDLPEEEWADEHDPTRLAQMLEASAGVVRAAVKGRVEAGQNLDLHYGSPVLLLGHLIWHEGYHHGQIKLALKIAGWPIPDEDAGPGTWDVWMRKGT